LKKALKTKKKKAAKRSLKTNQVTPALKETIKFFEDFFSKKFENIPLFGKIN